jgi:RES domain-containing protein
MRFTGLECRADAVGVSEGVAPADLPQDWVENTQATRAIGDEWLTKSATPLLAVPSALVPEMSNILLNPAHPDADQVVITQTSDHVIDSRSIR